jgi:hypothetical protein
MGAGIRGLQALATRRVLVYGWHEERVRTAAGEGGPALQFLAQET